MQRNLWWIFAVAVVSLIGISPLAAQDNQPLDNTAIMDLAKLGFGDSVIVEKIKSSRCIFDVSISGLTKLKAAGVSDGVIQIMIATTSAGQVAGGQTAAGDPNDPKSPHEAGIWLHHEVDGKTRMTRLEPSVYSQVKTGVAIFAAYGQTARSEAVLRSANAVIKTEKRRPTFYFYFEQLQSGLSDTSGVTSPNEFILAEFRTDARNNLRKLVVGQFNMYSGSQTGPEDKSVRSFDFEKITPGIYKVTPKEDLASGEYGFFYAGTSSFGPFVVANVSGGKIFDFSVKGPPETEPKPASRRRSTSPRRR